MFVRRYSVNVRATGVTAGAAFLELVGGSHLVLIREITATFVPSSDTEISLLRTSAVGTSSSTRTPIAHGASTAASAASVATAWSVAPTISGTPYMRRILVPSTAVIAQVGWDWYENEDSQPDEHGPHGSDTRLISVTNGNSVVVWNSGSNTSGQVDFLLVFDEKAN